MQNSEPFCAQRILLRPEQLVTRAEVGAQRGIFAAERCANLVPHARRGYRHAFKASAAGSAAPVGFLVDEKKALVQKADLPSKVRAEEECSADDYVGARCLD